MRPAVWAVFLPVCAGLAAAGAWSIQVGWGDYWIRQKTIAGTEAAMALMPDNAAHPAQLALLIWDDPAKAKIALRRAVLLNPWDARSWINLGLRAEGEGDDATAKQCLLRAADVDREFLPQWTLANYYFRHDDPERFWFWAKEAVAMVYGDAQPIFRLCGRMEENGKLIDRLGIRSPEVRAGYLAYLLSQNRLDLTGPAVRRLLEDDREADVPLLLTVCQRLLDASRIDEAVDLWKRLADAGRVPFRPGAGNGQLLTNGSFTVPPSSRGFDWRLPALDGVSVSREGELQGLRITFSGSEPEDCETLVQLVPVAGKKEYELRFEYRTQGIAGDAGLGWRIADARSGAILMGGPSLLSETDADGHLVFETPEACRLVRLALKYHRAPGTTRMEGSLVLHTVALQTTAKAPAEERR